MEKFFHATYGFIPADTIQIKIIKKVFIKISYRFFASGIKLPRVWRFLFLEILISSFLFIEGDFRVKYPHLPVLASKI